MQEPTMWTIGLPHWWEFVLRAVIVYVFLLPILRLTGKRQVGQLAPFDLVLLLVLGLIEGRPVILIHNGKIDRRAMRSVQRTIHELNVSLRGAGCAGMEEVRFALLENNGQVTVVPREKDAEDPSSQPH